MRRNSGARSASLLDTGRLVWFKRRIKVTNPNNRYENQDFEVGLMDERGAGESYETVYRRLQAAGNLILLEQITEYLTGMKFRQYASGVEAVREQYSL